MSAANHAKKLAHELETAQHVINSLVEENYTLKQLLAEAAHEQRQATQHPRRDLIAA
jgi:hypothetical protein